MSDVTDIEGLMDDFVEQADVVVDVVLGRRDGDVVEEICLLATALGSIPAEDRRLCGLNEYYEVVIEFALWGPNSEEVA